MKKFYKKLSIAIASLGLLLQLSTASAAIITFDYTDTDTVTVGDNFIVNVFADLSGDDLIIFGFDLTSLTNNVSFLSSTVHPDFIEDAINDVGASLFDPFASITGNIQLASLTFSADTIGSDTISLIGNQSNFGGIFSLSGAEDINTSFDINVIDVVKDVPVPTTISIFAIAGLLMLRLRRQG